MFVYYNVRYADSDVLFNWVHMRPSRLLHQRAQMLQKLVVGQAALAAIVHQLFDEQRPGRTRVAAQREGGQKKHHN